MKKSNLILKILPIGSWRREALAKIYRKVRPLSEQDVLNKSMLNGKQPYDKNKETIVLVSHESSATGAPLLGLNIGKSLSNNYNLIHYIMHKSKLHDAFFEDSILLVESITGKDEEMLNELCKKYTLKAVVGNSIVTTPVLESASKLKIPTLSLIHEFAGYVEPGYTTVRNILAADRVIIPANIIQDSISEQLNKICGIKTIPFNISVKPQGKLKFIPTIYGDTDSPEQVLEKIGVHNQGDYRIIVAAGSINIRKGIDLFISTARYIKKISKQKYKFVWVGDGLKDDDYFYSYWLKREINQFGLDEDFTFLNHQKNLDTIFSIADIYCLTSRMDPFPNIAIDALEANLLIACFNDASGTVEFLKKYSADAVYADYLDTKQYAEKIVGYLENNNTKSNTNSNLVEKYLNFDSYIDFIDRELERCENINTQNELISQQIQSSFDSDYACLKDNYFSPIDFYIKTQAKGLYKSSPNPMPGFSTAKWLHDNDYKKAIPLYEAINNGITSTHTCHKIPFDKKEINTQKVAIHLHLFYTDLSDEFNKYFQQLPGDYDLYITIVNDDDIETVRSIFQNSGAKNIEVTVVENVGRDIGPMIFDIKSFIFDGKYDVIGHFHSKKSMSVSNDTGDRWRKYLLDNLIGDKDIANSVLSLFNDEQIGLVFPEDRLYMDIGKNKEYVDALCQMMGLDKINETPLFPLGNMFWARVDAIKDIFKLDKSVVVQEEPLPYDGSYMHALERITPAIVEKNGYNYVTVYKNETSW